MIGIRGMRRGRPPGVSSPCALVPPLLLVARRLRLTPVRAHIPLRPPLLRDVTLPLQRKSTHSTKLAKKPSSSAPFPSLPPMAASGGELLSPSPPKEHFPPRGYCTPDGPLSSLLWASGAAPPSSLPLPALRRARSRSDGSPSPCAGEEKRLLRMLGTQPTHTRAHEKGGGGSSSQVSWDFLFVVDCSAAFCARELSASASNAA